jgi:oligoribonuclease NrnB/cAMP/cGMP phosphodiesterase (DHH superfamily)
MKTYYIYHHTDDDGWCSASVVLLHLLQTNKIKSWNDTNVKLISYSYEPIKNKFFPDSDFKENDVVFMVDLSVSENTKDKFIAMLLDMKQKNIEFTWIDHHKSSYDLLSDITLSVLLRNTEFFHHYIDINYCASYNCWYYLFKNSAVPEIIRIIDDWDCWKQRLQITKSFHYGFNSSGVNLPSCNLWYDWLTDRGKCLTFINECVEKGKYIIRYINEDDKLRYMYHFDCKFFGFNCCCLNARRDSDIFIDYDTYDLVLSFIYDGKYYKYSIYSANKQNEVFCDKIASYFNGGGHKGAAGFINKHLVVTKHKSLCYKIKDIYRKLIYRFMIKKG